VSQGFQYCLILKVVDSESENTKVKLAQQSQVCGGGGGGGGAEDAQMVVERIMTQADELSDSSESDNTQVKPARQSQVCGGWVLRMHR
jgi:hypothetical protein